MEVILQALNDGKWSDAGSVSFIASETLLVGIGYGHEWTLCSALGSRYKFDLNAEFFRFI